MIINILRKIPLLNVTIQNQRVLQEKPLAEHDKYMAKSLEIPHSITFAGEKVPLHIADVKERLDRELHINTYWHNNTIFLLKRANRWFPQIEPILKENNIPDDFKYLAAIEGSFMNDVSPAGAVGFWQILEGAGEENGLEVNGEVDERYHPLKSTKAACRYLNKAYGKFGNWTNAAASYNRGINGLDRALEHQKQTSYYDLLLNNETSRYMFRILAIKEIMENPKKYGFDMAKEHLYNPENVKYIEVTESIADLVTFSIDQTISYKLLKRHNPWLRSKKLTVKKGKTYRIAIPVK